MTRSFALAVGLILAGCASSPNGDAAYEVEVVLTDAAPDRLYEEIGSVVTRHWSVKEGLRRLQADARKLGADAIIGVTYSEYTPAAGKSVNLEWSRRRIHEGYALVIFEIRGVAVAWASAAEG